MIRYILPILILVVSAAQAETNLSMQDAIRLAQEHSYAIKSSLSDSIAAAYDLRSAQAGRFPNLSLNATSSYISELQTVTLPIGSLTAGAHYNYQADLRLTLPLFTGGRISNQIRAQREIAGARSYALEAQRLADTYNARRAYLALMAAQSSLAAAQASLERVKIINQDAQNLFASGMADSVDLLNSELAFQRAQQTRNERAAAADNASVMLARLLGFNPSEQITPSDSLPIPDFVQYENQGPLDSIEINRAELKSIQSRAKAAQYNVSLSRANYFPVLSGWGGYSVGKPNRQFFNPKWNDYYSAGLNLTWDFNLGGRNVYNVLSAGQTANSARYAYRDLEDSFRAQAQVAFDNMHLAYNSYVIAGRQYDIAAQQYRLGRQQERAGRLALNRLLELEADLTSMEQFYKTSMINYFISENEYLYTLGSPKIFGGF